jgi:hypothetical protein
MQTPKKSRSELYREFLEFIREDIQRERHQAHRRLFSAFFWCFLLPAFVSVSVLALVKAGLFPRSARAHLDWLVLVFPVVYSLYVLGSEVMSQVPAAFRQGGLASSLNPSLKELEWRGRVCAGMRQALQAAPDDWAWIAQSFRVDVRAMKYRTGYLTALAGAVFFLIMQGIDTLGGEEKVTWVKSPFTGWVETGTSDFSQFVGLALFLMLLYLSGNQTQRGIARYLDCVELNQIP